jgi:hypothetical protein
MVPKDHQELAGPKAEFGWAEKYLCRKCQAKENAVSLLLTILVILWLISAVWVAIEYMRTKLH